MKIISILIIISLTIIIGIIINGSKWLNERKNEYIEGGIYSTPASDGGFSILKILKIDENGCHIRVYSNNFSIRPSSIDENQLYMAGINRKPKETLGMGHLPLSKSSFTGWGVVFIKKSTVSSEELEGYRMWLEAKGGYF
jgi:hypothetical protein